MTFRVKVLIAGACAAAVILSLPYLAARFIILHSFAPLEIRQTRPPAIAGYAPVYDVWGDPIASLQITLPRDVHARGRATGTLLLVVLALGTILPIGAAALTDNPHGVQGASAVLAVQDTGHGMTPEGAEHACEPFFTTKAVGKGTGLGLTTVYGIVHQNRGTITLNSAPGQAAVMTIRLPAEAAPAAAPHRVPSRGIALPGSSKRVLLVEDQHEVRQLVQRMLQHMGYQVEAWGNPAEALARYNPLEHPYDLVLSDVAMPEMSGPELVHRLKERGTGFAVVYMSGYTEDCVLRRDTLGPGEQFLQKPFTTEQLAAAIRSALDRAPARTHPPGDAA